MTADQMYLRLAELEAMFGVSLPYAFDHLDARIEHAAANRAAAVMTLQPFGMAASVPPCPDVVRAVDAATQAADRIVF